MSSYSVWKRLQRECKFMKDMHKYFDIHFRKQNILLLIFFIASVVCAKLLHVSKIPENSLLENLQLIVLFAAGFLCFKFKNHKQLFKFVAMLVFLMFMREISYGRCIFCQLPDDPHDFYPWSHYKYGFLADILVGIYTAFAVLYAIVNKLWIEVKDIVTKTKFPVWDVIFMGILSFVQFYGEHISNNSCMEEIAEFMIYSAVFGFIYYYYRKIGIVS